MLARRANGCPSRDSCRMPTWPTCTVRQTCSCCRAPPIRHPRSVRRHVRRDGPGHHDSEAASPPDAVGEAVTQRRGERGMFTWTGVAQQLIAATEQRITDQRAPRALLSDSGPAAHGTASKVSPSPRACCAGQVEHGSLHEHVPAESDHARVRRGARPAARSAPPRSSNAEVDLRHNTAIMNVRMTSQGLVRSASH